MHCLALMINYPGKGDYSQKCRTNANSQTLMIRIDANISLVFDADMRFSQKANLKYAAC